MAKTLTLAEQVASLEDGYASLLLENKELGEQQDITRQAYQNLLAEKDEVIKAKLKHIELLDEALGKAKECNATLDHRLEQQGRKTATSVRADAYGSDKVTFGEVELAKRIYHNLHYHSIRALLGMEGCRILDTVLNLEQEG